MFKFVPPPPPVCPADPLQVLYIDHTKATKLLPNILEQNSIPAAHSKGLLEGYVPHVQPESMQFDSGSSSCSEDEVAAVGMAAHSKL